MNNEQYYICTSHTEREESKNSICYFEVYDFLKNIDASNNNEALGIFLLFNNEIYKKILISHREKQIKNDPDYFERYELDDIEEYKKELIVKVKVELINREIEHDFLIAKTMEIFPSENENEINQIRSYYLFKNKSS